MLWLRAGWQAAVRRVGWSGGSARELREPPRQRKPLPPLLRKEGSLIRAVTDVTAGFILHGSVG